jgi:homoserine kinase
MKPVTIQVPATTANLGPGFDCLGVALNLYNRVTVSDGKSLPADPFLRQTTSLFFKKASLPQEPFDLVIKGKVPSSRGLGSSVTVRLGLLAALNIRFGSPLDPKTILELGIELEGHPDNAVPGALGGFCVCRSNQWLRTPVDPRLHFIAAIPETPMSTKEARRVLPRSLPRAKIVENLQNTAFITAAFFSKEYERLRDSFVDHLHQPFRAPLLPGFPQTIEAARAAGALGAFLSGSGSTVMALTLERPKSVARVMQSSLNHAGHQRVTTLVLSADNRGIQQI